MPLDGATWFTDTEREILRSVREQISKPGAWCRRQIRGVDGSHCLLGWIYAESRHYRRVGFALIEKLGGWAALIELNDVLARSQDDVVAYLDRVIGQ